MLSINNLTYNIGDRFIYHNASLHISAKEKIGLIGLNGTGKSTLLRLINGDLTQDEGEIGKSKDCSIGYLNQDLLSFQSGDSILEITMTAFEETLKMEKAIEKLLHKMETNYEESDVDKLSKLQERYQETGGYELQSKAEEILEGVGFQTEDLHKPLREFSGGWRMRVMLAKLLLENPDLLMLDEPTNHLDLPSIKWLETYLRTYEGAVIVVSHDRFFLDNVVDKIVESEYGQLTVYNGGYSFYEEEKDLRKEIQKRAFDNQQQKIKQTERFIQRFRAKATKARQVQSKIKSLERMDLVEDIKDGTEGIHFKFHMHTKSGRHVMRMEHVSKSYDDLNIYEDTHVGIERGDKIAFIGANGKGKSTLLRMIFGNESFEGTRQAGHNVSMAFYAQHQIEALNINNDVLTEVMQTAPQRTELEIRSLLGNFMFSNDDVFKKIKVLSGGEKSRVALAKVLVSESNFLLLDEPTNHLDIFSVNILVQALQQYEGTFAVVSHDRHFISKIANKIWYIENHSLLDYPGTYEEFEYARAEKLKNIDKLESKQNVPKAVKKPEKSKDEIRELQKQVNSLYKKMEELEELISQEKEKALAVEEEMARPEVYSDSTKLSEKMSELDHINNKTEELNEQWENIALQIENKEKDLT